MMGRCLVGLFFQDRYLLNRVDMMGRCVVDLFFQDRYLLNRVDAKVRLVQSKDAFELAGAADQDYKIVEAALLARKAKVIPAVHMGHIMAEERGTFKYPLRSVDWCFRYGGVQCRPHNHNVSLGVTPERVVLCFIDNDTHSGACDRNP